MLFMLTAVSLVMRTVSVAFNVILTEKVGAEGMGLLTLVMSVNGLLSHLQQAVFLLVVKNDSRNCHYSEKVMHRAFSQML